MAYEALRHYSRRDMTFRFVSNVDSTDFVEATQDLAADETLFIISSKTFRTLETLTNAHSARDWALAQLGDGPRSPSTSLLFQPTQKGGGVRHRHREHVRLLGLGRWAVLDGFGHRPVDDAGRRPRGVREMLAGFHAMDEHFRTHRSAQNLPVLMGLLAVVRRLLRCSDGRRDAYEQYLKRFPPTCSSSRWSPTASTSTLGGQHVDYDTGAIYWGEPGTNGQHSFYQLIHQGTRLIPVDLIGFGKTLNPLGDHQTSCRPTCSRRRKPSPSARPRRRCGPRGRRTPSCPTGSWRATAPRT